MGASKLVRIGNLEFMGAEEFFLYKLVSVNQSMETLKGKGKE